jgi:hypothetical protein
LHGQWRPSTVRLRFHPKTEPPNWNL